MKHLHRLFGIVLLSGAALLAGSCDSGGDVGGDPPDVFDRPALLAHLGNNLILPAYLELQRTVDALQAAAGAFAARPDAATLTAAQQALKTARLAWQNAAVFQFGPAETVALRTMLNTYPADTGLIEANIASGQYVLGTVANRAAGGFPALDYLLHGSGDSPEETVAKYAADAQRIAYLQDNLGFIKTNTDATVDAWLPGGENYLGAFLSAEKAGVDVGSALGELYNALVLHYERYVRDGQIGIPAGVRSAGVPRPAAVEAYYGGYSAELAVAAVKAVRRLYLGTGLAGGEGPGLDAYARALGATALATEITTGLNAAVAALENLDDPLSATIQTNEGEVVAVFTTMQRPVVLLKADLASLLGITITFQDNDGD